MADDYADIDAASALEAPASAATPKRRGKVTGIDKLFELLNTANIAETLKETELARLSALVIEEYEIDKQSRIESGWDQRIKEATKLAMMVAESKDYPFEGAANVKYPLIANAALQFNARAYPAIVNGDRAAKAKTFGKDPDGRKAARAERVAEHLSWQLLDEMPEWEEDTDKLLVIVPIVGCAFRKVYYDPALKRKCSRLVMASDLVVNYRARSLLDVPRMTERLYLYPNEIEERIRSGRFMEFDYRNSAGIDDTDTDDEESGAEDADSPQLFLEQHRLYDIDGDGYPEPYVCTVHYASRKVVRVVANFAPETITIEPDGKISAIRRQDYYVKYAFLPNPDGGFYDMGFGWLLKDIQEAINSTLNQMLDAGHLSNVQGGLISSVVGLREKTIRLAMGEWRVLNTTAPINQSVMPITYPGPSAVLFTLLEFLLQSGKELASIKDVLTGETQRSMTATATMALIEQGLQVFTSIYKRMHRAFRHELAIHARLNREHLDPERYNAFFDGQEPFDPEADYADDMAIVPVSDPATVSKMQRLTKAQLLMEVSKENPMVNPGEALKRLFEAADIEDIETLIVPPPEPDPEQEALLKRGALAEIEDKEAAATQKLAAAMKAIADAEGVEVGQQMDYYGMVLDMLKSEHGMEMDIAGQGRVSGMEAEPDNATGAQALGGGGAAMGPADPGAIVPGNDIGSPALGGPAGAGGLPEGAL